MGDSRKVEQVYREEENEVQSGGTWIFGEDEEDESDKEFDMGGSRTPATSATTDDSDDDFSGSTEGTWTRQFDFAMEGLNAFYPEKKVGSMYRQDEEKEKCEESLGEEKKTGEDGGHDEGHDEHGRVSPTSSTSSCDLFEDCLSDLVSESGVKSDLLEDKPLDNKTGEEEKRLTTDTPKEYPVVSGEFFQGIVFDASETWDFSLRAKDGESGHGKSLRIDGPFYQKLAGICVHEMHRVQCECKESEKIPVCRLCNAVFCSNQCFKKTKKTQSGEEGGKVEREVPSNQENEEPVVPKELVAKPDKPPSKSRYQDWKPNAAHLQPQDWKRDSSLPSYPNKNVGWARRDRFQGRQETPFFPIDNSGFNGNTHSNYHHNQGPSQGDYRYKKHGWKSVTSSYRGRGGHARGSVNWDEFPVPNEYPISDFPKHPAPQHTEQAYLDPNHIDSSRATSSSSSSIPPTTSSHSTGTAGPNPNEGFVPFLDGGLHLPYGVSMLVKHVEGKNFSDFSVMTLRNWDAFNKQQFALQACKKTRMDICDDGNYCAVMYQAPSDSEYSSEEWYRGIIIKGMKSKVRVYLADLGLKAMVSRDDVYNLPPEHLHQPPLAIRVMCMNVKVKKGDPDVGEQFNALIRDRVVKIRITHKDQKEACRYGCFVDVEHMDKWFDAGILLKKLQVGDQATQEDIECEEQLSDMKPFWRFSLPDELLTVTGGGEENSNKTRVVITHVVSPNEFYAVSQASNVLKTQLELELFNPEIELKPVKVLRDLSYPLFMRVDKSGKRSRVKVLEMADRSTGVDITVQKVDTGEILTGVQLEELSKLPEDLLKPSCCAYKCSLPVKPFSKMRGQSMQLFSEATGILKEMKEKGQPAYMKVLLVEQPTTHIVDLYLPCSRLGCTSSFIKNGWVELAHDVELTRA